MTETNLILRPQTFVSGQVFTRPELAAYLRLNPRTLANWASTGKLLATYSLPLAPRYTDESLSPWMTAELEVAA